MEFFYRTDLACEVISDVKSLPHGVKYESFSDVFGNKTERMYIPPELENELGKESGNYVTLSCGKLNELDENELDLLSRSLGDELRNLIEGALGRKLEKSVGVLVVGLGNLSMTPDAVGPLTLQNLTATRHLSDLDRELYERLSCCAVSAISPGVLGQTGIESAELVRSAISCVSPDAVVVIDALAARSFERLGSTFQLCDTGIRPGSGIGNTRRELTRESLKIPVVAVGVPTVMDSSVLIYDTLSRYGKEKTADELTDVLNNGLRFFVSLKDCDAIVHTASRILGNALNSAFGIFY